MGMLILKFIWEGKETRKAKLVLKKKGGKIWKNYTTQF